MYLPVREAAVRRAYNLVDGVPGDIRVPKLEPSMTLVRWSRSSSFRRIRRWGQAAPKSPVRLVLGGSRSGRDAVHTAGRVADMGKRTASQGLPLPSEARVTGDARTGVRESVTKGITGADRREWSTCTGRRRPHDVGAGSPAAFDPSP